ncbi:HlyD family secretion protein [Pedobacter psychrotolerans]|uniref:Hemolysin n=1 Tax=Pedobacter psychrotolerans TaxID=1843235 RepID=A0A4V2RZX4_9SPHI|nr:HlyD family efflux transporter periplasmic adaptor subunit [Pedobacter psychrotolerans]TCO28800.1 HlyD family secretion protein [Pedobacter psychrotolerans]GGE51833.1 hemolysin [Pedobacter psychrotolerans]
MPQEIIFQESNSEDVEEIITAVPPWILRWGITVFFIILVGIVVLSSWIKYPDVVNTKLIVNSSNAPKQVLARHSGKLIALLVNNGDFVKQSQPLAFIESTAQHKDVLLLNQQLKKIRLNLPISASNINLPENLDLGELQTSYQSFFQQYLQFQSTQKNGYYLGKLQYLERDLLDIKKIKNQIIKQKEIQSQQFFNDEQEFQAYRKLYNNKVISRSEYIQQENKYLSAKLPLQQAETSILTNASIYISKQKELLDLRHTIIEERAKFDQSLRQCISESDQWIKDYILMAPSDGKVTFSGMIQVNQNIMINQDVFIVNPGNTDYFGVVHIPQYNMGKISLGQRALVKLKSYPYEQYGMIKGKLTYVSEVAVQDSVFMAKISFDNVENKEPARKIILRNGMQADVEIVTEESSLLQKVFLNILKLIK